MIAAPTAVQNPGDLERPHDHVGEPQHERVDEQEGDAEGQDHGRQREEDHERADDGVHEPEDEPGEHEDPEVALVVDPGEDRRCDEERDDVREAAPEELAQEAVAHRRGCGLALGRLHAARLPAEMDPTLVGAAPLLVSLPRTPFHILRAAVIVTERPAVSGAQPSRPSPRGRGRPGGRPRRRGAGTAGRRQRRTPSGRRHRRGSRRGLRAGRLRAVRPSRRDLQQRGDRGPHRADHRVSRRGVRAGDARERAQRLGSA